MVGNWRVVTLLSSIIHKFRYLPVLWCNSLHMDISWYAKSVFTTNLSFNIFSIFSLCGNDKSLYLNHIATVGKASIRNLSGRFVISNFWMFQPEFQTLQFQCHWFFSDMMVKCNCILILIIFTSWHVFPTSVKT